MFTKIPKASPFSQTDMSASNLKCLGNRLTENLWIITMYHRKTPATGTMDKKQIRKLVTVKVKIK